MRFSAVPLRYLGVAAVVLVAVAGIYVGWSNYEPDYCKIEISAPASAPVTFRDCPDCPEMVVVPPGRLAMGGPDGGYKNELPAIDVTIDYPIAFAKFETTFADWDMCVQDGGCRHRPNDQGWGRDHRPVINVSWNDTREYLVWLSTKTGRSYRLASESEWEYAARGRTTERFWWGPKACRAFANYGTDECCGPETKGKDEYEFTAPVGQFPPNPFGLYDMHGNVYEWVEDCYRPTYAHTPLDGSPQMGGICQERSHRGGSWAYTPISMRSNKRSADYPAHIFKTVGLRVVTTENLPSLK